MSKENKEYVVTQAGTRNYDVGEIVRLSDLEAARLVNKVRLKDHHDAETSKAGRKSQLEKTCKEQEGDIEELKQHIAKLEADIKQLGAQTQGATP